MRMNDLPSHETASWLAAAVYKFLPATLGAAIMIVIEPPKTRKELFWRLVAAFICSAIFGEFVMDFLRSLSWMSFLDPAKRSHQAAVDFVVGGSGWFMLGGVGVLLRRFRTDPAGAAEEAKRVGQ
jgi:uncharacterized membrane protein YeaQ/YmgE (transglycosylase-associated protein family)